MTYDPRRESIEHQCKTLRQLNEPWNFPPARSPDPRDALIAELCKALEPFETAIATIDMLPDVIRPAESHDAPTYLRLLAKQVTIADLRKAGTALYRARGHV